eukprot:gene1002-19198_t
MLPHHHMTLRTPGVSDRLPDDWAAPPRATQRRPQQEEEYEAGYIPPPL